MDLIKNAIRDVPDFPKPGILFKDITPLLSNAEAFKETINVLTSRYADKNIDLILGVEARGFILALLSPMRLGQAFP